MNTKSYFLMNSLASAVRLILSCIFNDTVYDESDKLFLAMDDINDQNMDFHSKTFADWNIFKVLSRDLPNELTIGGLMPLRKTTLLTVIINYFIN